VSSEVTRKEPEWDLYVEFFLEWCIERGHTGSHDKDKVVALTREFDVFARTPPIHETPFFKALSRAGIEHEMIDLPRSDLRFAEKKAQGCQRPRARIYNLPTQIPDRFVPTANAEPLPLAA